MHVLACHPVRRNKPGFEAAGAQTGTRHPWPRRRGPLCITELLLILPLQAVRMRQNRSLMYNFVRLAPANGTESQSASAWTPACRANGKGSPFRRNPGSGAGVEWRFAGICVTSRLPSC
jgi:hypothetical protein